jgi:N6-L-threonylcarbamoyladenine synthase/protein kinase Bud32
MYFPKEGSGIIPLEAADHHKQIGMEIINNTINKANLDTNDIDFISVANGPGLAPCLKIGINIAKEFAIENKKMLVAVNHCIAHIEIGKMATGCKDPIILYTSGGNTQVIAFTEGRYRIFGETEDVPIGNAIDTLAREIGLPQPYGPNFDKSAKSGKYVAMPYTVKGMDLSFSGMVTHAVKKFKAGSPAEDVCYSFQETAFAMLAEVTERALAHTDKNEVLLVGGVAASKRIQEMIDIMCKERSAKMFVVPKEYSGDNGAMIAWTGLLSKNFIKPESLDMNPRWRTDEVEIPWLKQKS